MKSLLEFVLLLVILAVATAASAAYVEPCHDTKLRRTPLCNASLTPTERATGFVALLTSKEKIGQLISLTDSVERLGLPRYQWWSEALHGVKAECFNGTCPTSYPAAPGLAASFNMDLVHKMATEISDEAHAMHDKADLKRPYGLNVWAPNVNQFVDPRWGRGQETPGEDPFLTSMYGFNYITGLQQGADDDHFRKLVATVKHFAVYNLESWHGMDRFHYDAMVSKQDLYQTYLVAFENVVRKADVQSIMCSYNAVNGVPSCANSLLLRDILRKDWGFDGFVVSDCDAVDNVFSTHKYTKSRSEASAVSLKAGTDLDCGNTYESLSEALERGLVTENDLDTSLTRLFKARIELGIFDELSGQAYAQIPLLVVNSPEHRATARQLARESIVLLKNDGNVLPLSRDRVRKLALVGPHAKSKLKLLSNYYGGVPRVVSVFEAITAALAPHGAVAYAKGCEIDGNSGTTTADIDNAVDIARSSDAAVVVLGLDQTQEREGMDRVSLAMPGRQRELLERVAAVNNNTVLVVVTGGAIDLSWAKENVNVRGILYAFYPGEEGGSAISDVLLGVYNPAGRLPYTIFPERYTNDFSMFELDMRAGLGRTYRFYTGETVYPFGFGLSYTDFRVSFALPPTPSVMFGGGALTLHVDVENTGSRAGDVSLLAFVESTHVDCPRKQLFAFEKLLDLAPAEKRTVQLRFAVSEALCVNKAGERIAPSGKYSLVVGDAGQALLRHDVLLNNDLLP